jgi:hypothetical protein
LQNVILINPQTLSLKEIYTHFFQRFWCFYIHPHPLIGTWPGYLAWVLGRGLGRTAKRHMPNGQVPWPSDFWKLLKHTVTVVIALNGTF